MMLMRRVASLSVQLQRQGSKLHAHFYRKLRRRDSLMKGALSAWLSHWVDTADFSDCFLLAAGKKCVSLSHYFLFTHTETPNSTSKARLAFFTRRPREVSQIRQSRQAAVQVAVYTPRCWLRESLAISLQNNRTNYAKPANFRVNRQ